MTKSGKSSSKKLPAKKAGPKTNQVSTEMLSSELREELGMESEDDDEGVLTSGTREKKEKVERVSEEILQKVKKLSKTQKKRIESVQRRQENERKQKLYLKTLEEHAISDVERGLLTSGKEVGQTDTLKQALQRTLRRYKAGLELSKEEHELLFPNGSAAGMDPIAVVAADSMDTATAAAAVAATAATQRIKSLNEDRDAGTAAIAVAEGEDVGLSLSAFGASTAAPELVSAATLNPGSGKKGKKSKKQMAAEAAAAAKEEEEKEKVAAAAAAAAKESGVVHKPSIVTALVTPAPAGGFGASMLGQLAALKASGALPQKEAPGGSAEAESQDMATDDTDGNEEGDGDAPQLVYRAQPIDMPDVTGANAEDSSKNKKPERTAKGTSGRVLKLQRSDDIQEARLQLPVCKMEQEIVEAINENDAVIVCGETGSGKSTQIPQFLYEYGYSGDPTAPQLIGVTQPRRVAAVSTANRVAVELGCPIDAKEEEEGGEQDDESDVGDSAADSDKKKRKASSKQSRKKARKSMKGGGKQQQQLVGYQIRHDASTLKPETAIKFMTDGILLREVSTDLMLRQYNVVILDEAHERSVNTDMLLGLLTRAVQARRDRSDAEQKKWDTLGEQERQSFAAPIKPLKLVIMSATLRVGDFLNERLFPRQKPPVVNVEARQYEVTEHFTRRTELRHYLKAAYKKVVQIHQRLPPGGILVFLTGKREIVSFVRKLNRKLHKKTRRHSGGAAGTGVTGEEGDNVADEGTTTTAAGEGDDDEEGGNDDGVAIDGEDDEDEYSDSDSDSDAPLDEDEDERVQREQGEDADEISLVQALRADREREQQEGEQQEKSEGDRIMDQMLRRALGQGDEQDEEKNDEDEKKKSEEGPAVAAEEEQQEPEARALVLPLYAMMSPAQQARVFAPTPANTRLIVVATNIAETSVTIPGIRYVVDSGRSKAKTVNAQTGINQFKVGWVSQASAEQRKGRAGRTGPGHVYRLFSAAFFHNYLQRFSPPEILQTGLEDLVLQMKTMGIADIVKFPFPTPPPAASIRSSVALLRNLGAIQALPSSAAGSKGSSSTLAWLNSTLGGEDDSGIGSGGAVTALGRVLASFSLSPRYAKMIVAAHRSGDSTLLAMTVSLVALLSDKSPFVNVQREDVLPDEDENENEDDEDEAAALEARTKKKKQKQEKAHLWFHPSGDAMARLQALGAFAYTLRSLHTQTGQQLTSSEAAAEGERFCGSNGLSSVMLYRALELRALVQRQCEQVLGVSSSTAVHNDDNHNRWNLSPKEKVIRSSAAAVAATPPPSDAQTAALRQVMLIGLVDCVAKKVPAGVIKEGSRRKRLTAYQSCRDALGQEGNLYIHPNSACYNGDPTAPLPEYILFSSLMRSETGETVYMSTVTPVHSQWLGSVLGAAAVTGVAAEESACPLLRYGPPLESPAPFYDEKRDCVSCYCVPSYGVHKWELSPVALPLSVAAKIAEVTSNSENGGTDNSFSDEEYRWFARFVLDGRILPCPLLRNSAGTDTWKEPSSVLTSSRPSMRAATLVAALKRKQVTNKAALHAAIKASKGREQGQGDGDGSLFLRDEVAAFMKAAARKLWREQYRDVLERL
jgi:ATP-dependent RNA helicase DHX37/DHR1